MGPGETGHQIFEWDRDLPEMDTGPGKCLRHHLVCVARWAEMNPDQLAKAVQCPIKRASVWALHITSAMERHQIDTPERQAAFLAQVGHESSRLQFVREIWNPVQCPWQADYEGRADLGNTHPGDGERFNGRGLIQITGRANYAACSIALFGHASRLLTNPELLEQPEFAAQSAGWFWESHGCNELADKGDFRAITRKINGGLNGYADRMSLLRSAESALA